MKPALYVCLKNPFTQRDLERMGIEALEPHFDLQILDCTAWLMPAARLTRRSAPLARANLRSIEYLRQFKAALGGARGGFAIDYVGQFSPQAILMFEALRARDIRIVALDSGAFPSPQAMLRPRSLAAKLADAFRHGGLRLHLNARANRLLLAILPDQRPDLALVSGSSWQNDPRFAGAQRRIEAHSFDYERFRQINEKPVNGDSASAGPYAVYLDEDIAGHEDNEEMGLASPASEQRFFPALGRFFDRFESATGTRVVIAGYPSGRAQGAGRFGERQVIQGRSAELIREASLVFAHASTAISFAVLWRRPLVFLTSEEIGRSWYQPWIDAPRAMLGAPLMDVDSTAAIPDPPATVDGAAYGRYQSTFLKSPRSPDLPLWEILRSAIMSSP